MTGIVFGNTFRRAEIQLNKIIQDYEQCHIFVEKQYKSKIRLEIIFDNGDIITIKSKVKSKHTNN